MRRALILFASALAIGGCAEQPVADAVPTSDASPAEQVWDKAAFDKAARAFVDAALAYTETCHLEVSEPGDWFAYISYDVCSEDPAAAAPIAAAQAALLATAPKDAVIPVNARAVLDPSVLFADWVATAVKVRVTRGTMLAYQRLALAYNAYDPEAKLPTEPKTALDEYFVKYPKPYVNYIWVQRWAGPDGERVDTYERRRRRGTPLVWRMGAQGPFLGN